MIMSIFIVSFAAVVVIIIFVVIVPYPGSITIQICITPLTSNRLTDWQTNGGEEQFVCNFLHSYPNNPALVCFLIQMVSYKYICSIHLEKLGVAWLQKAILGCIFRVTYVANERKQHCTDVSVECLAIFQHNHNCCDVGSPLHTWTLDWNASIAFIEGKCNTILCFQSWKFVWKKNIRIITMNEMWVHHFTPEA